MGEVAVESDACETPIYATTREDIHALLADGYGVDDDRLPAPDNTPRNTGKLTNRYIKRYGNGISQTIGGHHSVDKMQKNLMG